MNAFTQKLRLIYNQIFNNDIDTFTKAFIDYRKFNKKQLTKSETTQSKKEFFTNRKTVLRRWLQKGSNCTHDFQKSYPNYPISHYQLRGERLFKLEDFKKEDNLLWFEQRIEEFLKYQSRATTQCDYRYIYLYCEIENRIVCYEITAWIKAKNNQTKLQLQKEKRLYEGSFELTSNHNILISIKILNSKLYMLFHDNNDSSTLYTVGITMGYLNNDNKVPHSQKVVFSKTKLDKQNIELKFILNETETLSAIENRLNLPINEVKMNHFIKYVNRFKKYSRFFHSLSSSNYQKVYYYRLAFQEFYAIQKLFNKVAKEESYYIFNYQQAFLELIKTVENIQNTSLHLVMQLNQNNIFLQSSPLAIEIRSRFLNLFNNYKVQSNIIFVINSKESLTIHTKLLLSDMQQHHIDVRLIEKKSIINEVNSLDFSFIHLNNQLDFVLADPIRDSKDVYKLFINKLTIDEYRTDYQKFIEKSQKYNPKEIELS